MIATLNRTSGDAAAPPSSSGCELADIFRQHGQAYRQTHRLGRAQRKAMWDIEHCRTETLGGYRERCSACGYERDVYRSCRNRNCPKCQSMATAAWVEARRAELLPVPYFHVVFTLPHELKSWVVYAQAPFAGPRKLVDYLGRYTHRTAIGNQRIVRCEDGQVTFRYRDRADGDREKFETLPVDEFLDRFLQHVLPSGFFRVRHYGLLANCVKRKLLPHCRRLLGAVPHPRPADRPRTAAEWMQHLLGIDVTRCPCCGGVLERKPLPAGPPLADAAYASWAERSLAPWNTS